MSSLPAFADFPAEDVEPIVEDGSRVSEYYILHRDENLQGFFMRDAQGLYVPMDTADGVVRSGVLPGFQFRVADLARQSALAAMRNDALYRDFVLPKWQQAERQAREEAQARMAAEQEVERLRALLEQRDA